MTKAYIALGANLGDADASVADAARRLDLADGARVLRLAPGYLSAPHGPPEQPPYVNSVAEIETTLSPRALLDAMLAIESEMGRDRQGTRWGPRTIDLDLLLYGDATIDEPGLVVPHPRIAERRFVLRPLADLAPGLRIPREGRVVSEMLASCVDADLIEGPWAVPRSVRGRVVDHGGDCGLEAEGRDPADLATQAAHAFTAAVTDRDRLREADRREWRGSPDGPGGVAEVVAGLLSEILYWLDADGWLPARVAVTPCGRDLRAVAFGSRIRGTSVPVNLVPKAVTRHRLRAARIGSRGAHHKDWRIHLVIDI